MPRVFGRNNPEVDPKTAYRMEADRVMQAVTYLEPVGAKEYEPYWGPFDSVFQQAAFEGIYPDIFEELCKINDRVTFEDN